ncbi:MAG TPA: ATP synthase F1 subunit epsilon [Actinomycetota bacterium]|nr:ATP synthase F1 subunit epsilon [Actinomycetota bacterium]
MPLTVQVVTPEREVTVADDATFVLAHGTEGDIGIMPGHAPLLISLGVGPLAIEREGKRQTMLVDGGFLQVKNDSVIVLAEYAVLPDEIDAASLPTEIEELKRRLQTEASDEAARKELVRAEALQKLIQVG